MLLSNLKDSLGATMVETALSLSFFVLMITAMIDFARVLIVQSALTMSAQSGQIKAATESALDITTNDLADAEEWEKFRNALLRIAGRSLSGPLGVLSGPFGSGESVELIRFRTVYNVEAGTAFESEASNFSSDVVVLRPGEAAQEVFGSTVIRNPDIDPMPIDLANSTSMALLLKERPILVEIHARINLFTPFLGSMKLIGRAIGYREQSSPFSAPDELPFGTNFLTPQPHYTSTPVPDPNDPGSGGSSDPPPVPPACSFNDALRCAAACNGCIPNSADCAQCIDGAANG